jgi:hypothetical protein
MFLNKIELVNVDLRDTVPESSVCNPKWWEGKKFTPVPFLDTVIKTIPGVIDTNGYRITDSIFRYEIKVCCGEWGDYTNYSSIEYDCNMNDDYFIIYNELYYDFEITDEFMPEVVKSSLRKNDKPYGFGAYENYMTQGNQLKYDIYSLEDLEDFKRAEIENKQWYDYRNILDDKAVRISYFTGENPYMSMHTREETEKAADFVIKDFLENILGFSKMKK